MGRYQPDPQQSKCLACATLGAFSTAGANGTAGTGATACVAASPRDRAAPWLEYTAAAASLVLVSQLALALACGVGAKCLATRAGKRLTHRWRGSDGGFDSDSESSSGDDGEPLSRRREGQYTVTSKAVEVLDAPSLTAARVGPPKQRGDLLDVEASTDGDWLLLAHNEGWVLGFDPLRGARVALVRYASSPRSGKTTKAFRSSVHQGSANNGTARAPGSGRSKNSSGSFKNSGALSSGGGGARGAARRASAFGARLLAPRDKAGTNKLEVKRGEQGSVVAHAAATEAYYAVAVEDGDLLALGGAPPPPGGQTWRGKPPRGPRRRRRRRLVAPKAAGATAGGRRQRTAARDPDDGEDAHFLVLFVPEPLRLFKSAPATANDTFTCKLRKCEAGLSCLCAC